MQHAALLDPMSSLATCGRETDWPIESTQLRCSNTHNRNHCVASLIQSYIEQLVAIWLLHDWASKLNVNEQRACCGTSARAPVRTGRRKRSCTRTWTSVSLHQLSLVDVCDAPLQLLRVLWKELELGAVSLWVFPRVVVPNFSWATGDMTQEDKVFQFKLLCSRISCKHLEHYSLLNIDKGLKTCKQTGWGIEGFIRLIGSG